MHPLALAALSLLVGACSDDAVARAFPPVADTLVISEDAELRSMALEMLPELTARSGLEVREPIRLARRTRAELEGFLQEKLDETLPEERARRMTAVYAKLGLMPEAVDLRALLLSVYQEQVAGFYDPEAGELYVMEDQGAAAVAPILLHELVHAVQDQWTDLDAATDPERGNDRVVAAQSAIEGHATLVMLEYMTEQMQGRAVDLTEIPGFAGQMRQVLEAARSQYPELAQAPRVVQEGMLFPYLEGAGFVLEVWRERGNREGGVDGILPLSTEQVLDPARFLGEPPDLPTELVVEVPGDLLLYTDGLGAAETRILLEELAGEEAGAAATGWDGDRYALVGSGVEDSGLVWVSVWDDEASRDRFTETLAGGLGELTDARLERVEVDGRPGALLTVGRVPGGIRLSLGAGVP